MKRVIEDLLALQQVDMRIRALKIRLNTIPNEREALVQDFEVVRTRLEKAKFQLMKTEQEQKKQAEETRRLQDAHRNLLIKSGEIKKVAEYHAILKDIEVAKQKISDSETRELELMNEQEEAQKNLQAAERKYRAVGRSVKSEVISLDQLKGQIIQEIEKQNEASRRCSTKIPMLVMDDYKRFLASGKGEPVGKIRNGNCPNCMLKLSPQTLHNAKKGDLVHCDNCSFFLYDENPIDSGE